MPECHADSGQLSRGQTPNVARETRSNITEQNRTELNTSKPEPKPALSKSIPKPEPRTRERPPHGITNPAIAAEFVFREADWRPANGSQRQGSIDIIRGWLAFAPLELILAGIRSARSRKPNEPTKSLKRFDSTIRGMAADRGIEPRADATELIERTAAGMRATG